MELKFKRGDRVKITKGFYRETTGTVESYSKIASFFGLERYILFVDISSCGYYADVKSSELELVSDESTEKHKTLVNVLKEGASYMGKDDVNGFAGECCRQALKILGE